MKARSGASSAAMTGAGRKASSGINDGTPALCSLPPGAPQIRLSVRGQIC